MAHHCALAFQLPDLQHNDGHGRGAVYGPDGGQQKRRSQRQSESGVWPGVWGSGHGTEEFGYTRVV